MPEEVEAVVSADAEPSKVEVNAEKKDKDKGDKGDKAKGKGKGKGKGKEGKGKRVDFSGPTGSGGYRLNVKNLSSDTTTKEQLTALFEAFGTVSGAEVKVREDGASRGHGYVILGSEDEAKNAIAEMNGKTIGGKALNVAPAERRATDDDIMGMGKGKGKGGGADIAAQQQAAYMMQFWAMQQQQAYTAAMMAGMYGGMGGGMPGMGAGMPGMPPPFPGMDMMGLGMGGMGMGLDAGAAGGVYEGSLKSVNAKNGYGFIVCSETYKLYNRDVYIDKSLLGDDAEPGDRLRFTVSINDKGHPKAATATKM